jgi:hypothetical protein
MKPRLVPRRLPRRPTTAGAALAVLAATGPVVAACGSPAACTPVTPTGPAASGGTASTGPGSSQPRSPAATAVTLPTGERVRVAALPGGEKTVTPLGAGASSGFVRFSFGGDQYLIPYEAVPYLGSVLDPRLFDVSYLAAAHLGRAGLPVTVTYRPGPARGLPGIRVTRTAGDIAMGTVTKAALLGRLFAGRWRAGQAGLAGIARISLGQPPGAPALPAAPAMPAPGPHGPRYHTLTLRFIGLDGKPADAVGVVQNVGDARLGTYLIEPTAPTGKPPITGQRGPVSFSLPDGTYSIMFSILTPHPGTLLGVDAALVAKPQVTLGSDQTITLDARDTQPYRVTVAPRASAAVRVDQIDLWRGSVAGGGCGGPVTAIGMGLYSYSGAYGDTGSQLRAAPTRPVTKGSFYFDPSTVLDPYPDTVTRAAPRYYLDFPHAGSIPASLKYTVPRHDLTAVHEDLFLSPPGVYGGPDQSSSPPAVAVTPTIFHTWGDFVFMAINGSYDNVAPGNRTDYWYTSDPRLSVWENTYSSSTGCACTAPVIAGPRLTTRPGGQVTEVWNKWPLVPTPAAAYLEAPTVSLNSFGHFLAAAPLLTVMPASRQDNNGVLDLQFGDSDPAHQLGNPFTGFSGVSFYRAGKLAIAAPAFIAGGVAPENYYLPLLPQATAYRLVWAQREAPGKPAAVTTNWTFHSGPAVTAAHQPATEECAVDPGRPCSFLPLLFLAYNLPLNPDSQATAGHPVSISFTVRHQQGQPPPGGVSATVSASFDDGNTWSAPQAAASLGGDRFAVTISQPPLARTTGFASLRVTARDGAGNTVTQTIIRAYGLTG